MSTKNFNLSNAPEELGNAVKKLNEMGVDLTVIRDYLTRKYTIEFMHVDLMEPIRFDKLVTFDRKLCTEIIDRGLDIDGQALTDAMNIILKHKALLIEHHTHSIIGFHNGRYYHNDIYEVIPADPDHPVEEDPAKKENSIRVITSEYIGGIGAKDSYGNRVNPLAPKGDLQSNIAGLRELVIPHTGLVLGLAAGASGLVLQHLDNLDTNITLTFYGESSRGKSTCEHIILSLFGDVELLKEHFNATSNYQIESMAARGILPCVIDEIKLGFKGTAKKAAMAALEFIFAVAAGRSRSTLKKMSQLFRCPCIFSAEESIFVMVRLCSTKGQLYRMIEVKVDNEHPLTISDAHAKAIEAHILEHHGLVIPHVEQYMLEKGLDSAFIHTLTHDLERYLLDTYKQLEGDDRIALRMAIILATAKILDDACAFGIDHKKLEELLVNSFVDGKNTMTLDKVLYTKLKRLCKENRHLLGTYANYDDCEHIGLVRCDTEHSYTKVCFTPDRLRKLLSGRTCDELLQEAIALHEITSPVDDDPFAYLDDDGVCKDDDLMPLKEFNEILAKWRDAGYLHTNTARSFTKPINLYGGTEYKRKMNVICIEIR